MLLLYVTLILCGNPVIVVTVVVVLQLSSHARAITLILVHRTCLRDLCKHTEIRDLCKHIGQPGNSFRNPKQCCIACCLQNSSYNIDSRRAGDLLTFFYSKNKKWSCDAMFCV